jgi:hypothetical protein
LRPPKGLAPVEPKWYARSITQSFRMLFLPTTAHTTPHRADNCALKTNSRDRIGKGNGPGSMGSPGPSTILCVPSLDGGQKTCLGFARRGLHDILADAVDHHETPCIARDVAQSIFRTRPAAFKPMIKSPGRNCNFLTTSSKVTCGKLTRDAAALSMIILIHRAAIFIQHARNPLSTCPCLSDRKPCHAPRKAGHPVTADESGRYWIARFAWAMTHGAMQFFPTRPSPMPDNDVGQKVIAKSELLVKIVSRGSPEQAHYREPQQDNSPMSSRFIFERHFNLSLWLMAH